MLHFHGGRKGQFLEGWACRRLWNGGAPVLLRLVWSTVVFRGDQQACLERHGLHQRKTPGARARSKPRRAFSKRDAIEQSPPARSEQSSEGVAPSSTRPAQGHLRFENPNVLRTRLATAPFITKHDEFLKPSSKPPFFQTLVCQPTFLFGEAATAALSSS